MRLVLLFPINYPIKYDQRYVGSLQYMKEMKSISSEVDNVRSAILLSNNNLCCDQRSTSTLLPRVYILVILTTSEGALGVRIVMLIISGHKSYLRVYYMYGSLCPQL